MLGRFDRSEFSRIFTSLTMQSRCKIRAASLGLMSLVVICIVATLPMTAVAAGKPMRDKPVSIDDAKRLIETTMLKLAHDQLPENSAPFGTSTLGATVRVIGFAFCTPTDPTMPPTTSSNQSTSLYGCPPDLATTLQVSPDRTQLLISVRFDNLFVDADGTWQISAQRGTFEAYSVFTSAQWNATAPLIEVGKFVYDIGPIQFSEIEYTNVNVDIDTGNTTLDILGQWVVSMGQAYINESIAYSINESLNSLPDLRMK